MKKILMGIILILVMVVSFSVVVFADLTTPGPFSAPICIDVNIQE